MTVNAPTSVQVRDHLQQAQNNMAGDNPVTWNLGLALIYLKAARQMQGNCEGLSSRVLSILNQCEKELNGKIIALKFLSIS